MWDNLEDAFKDLDKDEYHFFAKTLGSYRRALETEGFNKEEAFKLVEAYSKFVYDMVIEEMLNKGPIRSDDDDSDLTDEDQIG